MAGRPTNFPLANFGNFTERKDFFLDSIARVLGKSFRASTFGVGRINGEGHMSKKVRNWAWCIGALFLVGPCVMAQNSAQVVESQNEKLSRKIVQKFDETVLSQFAAGNSDGFLLALAELINRLDAEELIALEQYGASKGIPSLRGTFSQLVLEAVEQGRKLRIDISEPDLALYLMSGISDYISKERNEIRQSPVMVDQIVLPEEWTEREQAFWKIHVLRNRFLTLQKLAGYVGQLAKSQLKSKRNLRDPARKESLEQFAGLGQEIDAEFLKLQNNEAMMRLDELLIAEDVLHHTLNFEDRLFAAYALEDDGRSLLGFLKNISADKISYEPLKKEELENEVQRLMSSGREHGKDVIEKALLLRVGAHWWLRGRFGGGALANGLLKTPDAMKSEEIMTGLYMPKEPDKPICEYLPQGQTTPGYDRRNYYAWAVEYRRKKLSSRAVSTSISEGPPREETFY
jgi:hypothetical protein